MAVSAGTDILLIIPHNLPETRAVILLVKDALVV